MVGKAGAGSACPSSLRPNKAAPKLVTPCQRIRPGPHCSPPTLLLLDLSSDVTKDGRPEQESARLEHARLPQDFGRRRQRQVGRRRGPRGCQRVPLLSPAEIIAPQASTNETNLSSLCLLQSNASPRPLALTPTRRASNTRSSRRASSRSLTSSSGRSRARRWARCVDISVLPALGSRVPGWSLG